MVETCYPGGAEPEDGRCVTTKVTATTHVKVEVHTPQCGPEMGRRGEQEKQVWLHGDSAVWGKEELKVGAAEGRGEGEGGGWTAAARSQPVQYCHV